MKKNQHTQNKSTVRDGFISHSKELSHILPSPAMLESYEELHPGMIEKLLSMVEKEQLHRHNLEKNKILYEVLAGHIAMLIKILAVGLVSAALTIIGNIYIAIISVFLISLLFLKKKSKIKIGTKDIGKEKGNSNQNIKPLSDNRHKKYRFRTKNIAKAV